MGGLVRFVSTPRYATPRRAADQLHFLYWALLGTFPVDEVSCADLEKVKKTCVKNIAAVTSETVGMKNITLVFPYDS